MSPGRDLVRLRHRVSLRLRITLVTSAVVAVVVALGGLLILVSLRAELLQAADQAVTVRAEEVAVMLERAEGPPPATLPVTLDPVTFAEIVSGGQLVSTTEGLDASDRFGLDEQPVGQVDVVGASRLPLEDPGPFRVAALGVDTSRGPMTVFVAVSINDLEHTMRTATRIGAVGLSILVLVLGSVTWLAIGRTLAPVEAIRARAEAITGDRLDRRVPVPPHDDEIGRLARTVNRMLGRLQRSAERQRRFVADAAHELRSPIASLRVQLETAEGRPGSGRREQDLLYETGRMEQMVDQLLLLARADADASWVRWSLVDLDDVVDTVVGPLTPDAPVIVDTRAVEPVQVPGDVRLLERAVGNLVQNARAHARHAVQVTLSRSREGLAVLTVDDDGPGIPPDHRDDVFERFFRLNEPGYRNRDGVGLGLAIVSEIVTAHGGRVWAGDSPAGGARFTVELATANPPGPEGSGGFAD